jgi:branched-chain amino acid transport system permease protein
MSRYATHVARLRAKAAWHPLEVAFWLLPVAAYFLLPTQLALLSQAAVFGLFALSLDLLVGYAGIVSLGHAAFFGLGAYTAGIMAQHGLGEPLSSLAAAAAAAGLLGFATSFLVLRGSDLTRLMVTLGLGMMLYELANKMSWLTGGADGMQGIEVKPIFGLFEWDLYNRTAYVYSMVMLFLAFLLVRRLVHSPFGQSLRGIKQNERRMHAMGTPVQRRLIAVYTLAAVLAGVAGAVLTHTTQFASLEALGFGRSADALLIVVLGGAGTLYGALIGSIAFIGMHHSLSLLTPQYWQFWMGMVLVLLVLFARGGILGVLVSLFRRVRPSARPPLPTGRPVVEG